MMTVNQKVRFLIKRARAIGDTDVKIAGDIGVSGGSIYKWTSSNTNPDRDSIKKISVAYGIPVAVFDDDSIHLIEGTDKTVKFEKHEVDKKPIHYVFPDPSPEIPVRESPGSYRSTGDYNGPENRQRRVVLTKEERRLLQLFRHANENAKPVIFNVLESNQVV